MSRTYSLCCHDCRISLWIGQKSSEFYLYLGDGMTDAKLTEFLWEHQGHSLGFGDDEVWMGTYARWSEDEGVWTLEPGDDDGETTGNYAAAFLAEDANEHPTDAGAVERQQPSQGTRLQPGSR